MSQSWDGCPVHPYPHFSREKKIPKIPPKFTSNIKDLHYPTENEQMSQGKGPFQKEMNHLPTINFQCVCVGRLKRRKTCIIMQGAGGDGGVSGQRRRPPHPV